MAAFIGFIISCWIIGAICEGLSGTIKAVGSVVVQPKTTAKTVTVRPHGSFWGLEPIEESIPTDQNEFHSDPTKWASAR